MCGCLSHAPKWDPTCNPGMCPDWEWNWWPFVHRSVLNPLSHSSQGESMGFGIRQNWVRILDLLQTRAWPGSFCSVSQFLICMLVVVIQTSWGCGGDCCNTDTGMSYFLKVCISSCCFYKRLLKTTLVSVFASQKKSKGDFCFKEKWWKERRVFSICFSASHWRQWAPHAGRGTS